jgi:hypothetical protein
MTRRTAVRALAASALPPVSPREPRFVGVTVMPEYVQTETIDRVLDNLVRRAQATAVTISPYVMEPADPKTGSREPPIDAGAGKVRLLDRPLWGRRELFVRTAPSYVPERKLYAGLLYQPAPPTELTRSQGPVVRDFIRAGRARGLKAYFQIQAAIPPGYRVQFGGPVDADQPRLPDGRIPARRLANNGSLASPDIRSYTQALIRDLCRAYPEMDGLRVDWPEYPPYFLDDLFLDFSRPARLAAQRLGIPFEPMRRELASLYRLLHGSLTNRHLAAWLDPDGGRYELLRRLADRPLLLEFLRFKALLVEELLAGFRKALTEAAGAGKELLPNAFPPPFALASGMDFARAARHAAGISVKLYTMHWPMMLRFYGEELRAANPGLSEALLVRALVRWFDIADDEGSPSLSDYSYPEPDQPHPVGLEAQARKIRQAQAAAGATPVYALAHAYGPPEDFRTRVRTAYQAAGRRLWVNRYGYLSDEKLEIIGEVAV